MAAQRQELATQTFSFTPRSLEEAEKYAMIIANSGICPQALKGRPNDVLVILQLGHELKLKPMQALRSLGCINGVPFAWGDGQLALVKNHPEFVGIKEWLEGDIKDSTLTAYCTITREGQEPQTRSFDIEDAKRARLWMDDKKPVWKMFPKRMLQHRARSFTCRDVFPDALFGLMSEDEAQNVPPILEKVETPKAKSKGMSGLEEVMGLKEEVIEASFEVIEDEPVEDALTAELLSLISEKNVPEKSIRKWCAQFSVDILEDIPAEGKEKIINHLKEKG